MKSSPQIDYWFLGLLSPAAFAMGIEKLLHFEAYDEGVSLWFAGGTLPIAGSFIMMTLGKA